jgi:ElaB/YqjD/DUF883 family membrane-anchored ribosome-binding protein
METLNKVAARVHGALNQVVDSAAPAAQWLEEHGEAVTAGGEKLLASTRKFVLANPLQTLGLALSAGYLIGRLAALIRGRA